MCLLVKNIALSVHRIIGYQVSGIWYRTRFALYPPLWHLWLFMLILIEKFQSIDYGSISYRMYRCIDCILRPSISYHITPISITAIRVHTGSIVIVVCAQHGRYDDNNNVKIGLWGPLLLCSAVVLGIASIVSMCLHRTSHCCRHIVLVYDVEPVLLYTPPLWHPRLFMLILIENCVWYRTRFALYTPPLASSPFYAIPDQKVSIHRLRKYPRVVSIIFFVHRYRYRIISYRYHNYNTSTGTYY